MSHSQLPRLRCPLSGRDGQAVESGHGIFDAHGEEETLGSEPAGDVPKDQTSAAT